MTNRTKDVFSIELPEGTDYGPTDGEVHRGVVRR